VALLGMGAWWGFWQVEGRWDRIYYGIMVAALVVVCVPMALEVKSVQYRATYAVNCLPIIAKKPLTGYGAGTFQIVYQVWDEPIAQIPDAEKRSPKRLHNDWLQAVVEHGVIYAGMMFWMWAAWCVKAARRKDWAVSLSLGALGLVAAMDFPLQIPVHCAVFWMLGGVADGK
jgi:O-antigen ligase